MSKAYLIILILSNILQCVLLENSTIITPTSKIDKISGFTIKDPGIGETNLPEKPIDIKTEEGSTTAPIITSIAATVKDVNNSTKNSIIVPSELSAQAESIDSISSTSTSTSSTTTTTTTNQPQTLVTTQSETIVANSTTESTEPKLLEASPYPSNETSTNSVTSAPQPKRPTSCSGRNPHEIQPIQTELSMIKKCCPIGENFPDENATQDASYCGETTFPFRMNPIAITLYDGCIEDNETVVEMDVFVGNLCNRSVRYGEDMDDRLYVIQNGSLLIMDAEGSIGFRIYDDYCLDVNYKTGKMDAVVCVSPPVQYHITADMTILYTAFMMISIPCLIFVSFIHFAIEKLRNLHGLCIGSMSWCLALGFSLHSISQLSTMAEYRLQYAVQYFILAYYMWMLALCFNIVLFLWVYVLRYINMKNLFHWMHFVVYFLFAMILPISLVVYTKVKRIPGMPSYFQQGWSESIKSGQRYFIPPVSTILGICFVLLVAAFFGFRKLDEILKTRDVITYHLVSRGNEQNDGQLPKIDRALADEVQLNARCIAMLFIIVSLTWIVEVVTFYSPGAGDYLAFLEAMNALQGVFILIIFVVIRNKRKVIASWWHDRGSHNINETEMSVLNNKKDVDVEKYS